MCLVLKVVCINFFWSVYCQPCHSSIYSFIHLSIYLSIHSFVHLSIHSSIHSFIRPFIHSSIHPFIHSSIYLFIHPLQHLQAMTITNYTINKANNDYFYLTPSSSATSFPRISLNSVSPLTSLQKRHSTGRCSSPSSPPPLLSPKKRKHQRSVSWSSTPRSPLLGPPHSHSSMGSVSSSTGIGDSNYDASGSNTSSSFAFSVPCTPSLMEDLFWLVIRVLPLRVEVYLHNRFV